MLLFKMQLKNYHVIYLLEILTRKYVSYSNLLQWKLNLIEKSFFWWYEHSNIELTRKASKYLYLIWLYRNLILMGSHPRGITPFCIMILLIKLFHQVILHFLMPSLSMKVNTIVIYYYTMFLLKYINTIEFD